MKEPTSFPMDKKVLPEVYSRVTEAKQCIMNAEAANTSEVVRMARISRSVFYEYKDSAYPYRLEAINQILTVQAVLYDRPDVLMLLVSELYGAGANTLTINQDIPVSGKVMVSISARINNMMGTIDGLLALPRNVDGICSTDNTTDQQKIGLISFQK